ncbi:hypothetical protein BJ322DRAFT_1021947 [Thelephora terrestris]|uniref:Uncharacterized protein n=1 Tax=Thelephora terrestris TaxID=56493 RepID=A0A9P6L580_9AGAM|nr:hypothetical protein BJ322DRAFT_1021947 [Thelephora terrestris]
MDMMVFGRKDCEKQQSETLKANPALPPPGRLWYPSFCLVVWQWHRAPANLERKRRYTSEKRERNTEGEGRGKKMVHGQPRQDNYAAKNTPVDKSDSMTLYTHKYETGGEWGDRKVFGGRGGGKEERIHTEAGRMGVIRLNARGSNMRSGKDGQKSRREGGMGSKVHAYKIFFLSVMMIHWGSCRLENSTSLSLVTSERSKEPVNDPSTGMLHL